MAITIEAFPHFLNKHIELRVSERMVETRFSGSGWQNFWRPFLTKLAEARQQHPHRMMIAVAGPPGSGKSMFAEQLNWLLSKGVIGSVSSIALPQDGFHFDGYYLKSHYRTLANGEKICLADVKGAADTFDAGAMKGRLEQLRAGAANIGWPGYNRTEHETMENRFRISDVVSVIIVEGNYLLVNSGPYAGFPQLFDLKIYLDTPGARIIAGLMDRHMAGGKTMEQAKAWVKKVDLPNAQLVDGSKQHADVIIRRNEDDELESCMWRGARLAG